MPFVYTPETGGGGGDGYLKETLYSADQPGVGANVLNDGESRIWVDTANSKTYLVSRTGTIYKLVESSN